MPYFTITDFAAGLDLRRSALTAPPGTLRRLVNCHISPGGEIEKRYTFQYVTSVDPLSRGIVEVGGQLYVFKLDTSGSYYPGTSAPGVWPPAASTPPGWGVGTFHLQGMSAGDIPITDVFDYDTYGGSVFAITYHAGSAYPENVRRFYKGLYLKQVSSNPGAAPPVYSLTNGIHGHYCRTYKDKMFVVEGSALGSSCVGKPEAWENVPETEPPTGVKTAGFFSNDLSLQDSDMTNNVAIEVYYSKLAVMGKHATQLWIIDPDPSKMQYDSTLRGTGTIAWRSVLQYGSGDVLFLANDGVRSLQARNSSLAASVSDVGSPIDPLIQDLLREWGEYSMSQAISIVQPVTGRVWVIMPLARNAVTGVVSSRIFVLSAFPGPKISAWSEYRPPFNAVAACTHNNRIVLRDDQHNIWVYGSMEDTTDPAKLYDACPVEVVLPFHGADPATKKKYKGIDASCEGDWEVYASYEPNTITPYSPDNDAESFLGYLTGASYEQGRWPMEGWSTHLSLRLRSGLVGDKPGTIYTPGTTGRKSISNLTIHYDKADAD